MGGVSNSTHYTAARLVPSPKTTLVELAEQESRVNSALSLQLRAIQLISLAEIVPRRGGGLDAYSHIHWGRI